mgnify:CR=1 FL=1
MLKAEIMDRAAVERSLIRIAHEIIEKNGGTDNLLLMGILRRGVPIAQKIAENIEKFYGVSIPVGTLDITFYRDDLSPNSLDPISKESVFPVDPQNKTVVLVDDVIYTGRTTRAAMDAVIAKGRPSVIRLAVLVDRGHRELPIRGDFVGKNIPTSKSEFIRVCVDDFDGKTCVEIHEGKM